MVNWSLRSAHLRAAPQNHGRRTNGRKICDLTGGNRFLRTKNYKIRLCGVKKNRRFIMTLLILPQLHHYNYVSMLLTYLTKMKQRWQTCTMRQLSSKPYPNGPSSQTVGKQLQQSLSYTKRQQNNESSNLHPVDIRHKMKDHNTCPYITRLPPMPFLNFDQIH